MATAAASSKVATAQALAATIDAQVKMRASAAKKVWWENYMKHAVPFHGTDMAGIRAAVSAALAQHGVKVVVLSTAAGTAGAQTDAAAPLMDTALKLFTYAQGDSKLAGIVLLAEHALPSGALDARWPAHVEALGHVYEQGAVADWSTCDWLCVKVLGPCILRYGQPCGVSILSWATSPCVWKSRAACVSFVNLVKLGDAGTFPEMQAAVLEACSRTLSVHGGSHRWAHTGTGWVVREVSKVDREAAIGWVRKHAAQLTAEGLKYACERMPAATAASLTREWEAARARAGSGTTAAAATATATAATTATSSTSAGSKKRKR